MDDAASVPLAFCPCSKIEIIRMTIRSAQYVGKDEERGRRKVFIVGADTTADETNFSLWGLTDWPLWDKTKAYSLNELRHTLLVGFHRA